MSDFLSSAEKQLDAQEMAGSFARKRTAEESCSPVAPHLLISCHMLIVEEGAPHMCRGAEGSVGVLPLFPPSGAYGPNSGPQAFRQESLPAEPSSQLFLRFFKIVSLAIYACLCVDLSVCAAGAGRSMQMPAETRRKHGCAADGVAGQWL